MSRSIAQTAGGNGLKIMKKESELQLFYLLYSKY